MCIFVVDMDIVRFVRNWTLPVSMTAGTVIYLVFANVPFLAGAAEVMSPVCDKMLPAFMFMILFVTFCKVDFRKLRLTGWHFWIGLFQIILVGTLVGIALGFHLSGDALTMMEALLTCVVAPVAAAAAVVTSKLGGDLEKMTTFTFVSNLITALLIPICFPLIDPSANVSFIGSFAKIFYEVCVVLVLPMAMAYVVKHMLPRLHRRIVSVKDLSYYMWGCSLMMVTGTTVKNICHAGSPAAFIVAIALMGLLVCIAQFSIGRFIGHYFNATVDAGQALGQKNTAFAIWIAYTYLNPLSSVGPGCYILWQNIINSVEIWMYRRKGMEKAA